jgi:phage terminase Nu1 subunit (DNA packaging protein)
MAEGVAAKVIADILDLDERTVRKYAAAGIMVRIGHGKYALRESVRVMPRSCAKPRPGTC